MAREILTAEVELACTDLGAAVDALVELGLGVDLIEPADDPQTAVVSGHGVRLRLVRDPGRASGVLRLVCRDPGTQRSIDAGGLRIDLVAEPTAAPLPASVPSFQIARGDAWHLGRAGMQYRDLIPDRYGGRFIASHIRIPDGGPVPDYVHFHAIRFQLIYCYKGWVRVVYEDQGEPFVMHAGDCVIQPPKIRHRVLEASAGLEVVEVGCPAQHATYGDRALALPNGTRPRDFDGQTFIWHRAGDAAKQFAAASLGIDVASAGLAGARIVTTLEPGPRTHDAELLFGFVLRGELTIRAAAGNGSVGGDAQILTATDAFTIPAGMPFALAGSPDLALLEVSLPARVNYSRARGEV